MAKEMLLAAKLNKFKGCLLGLAIGDALGAPVEKLSAEEIHDHYGILDRYIDATRGMNPEKIKAGEWTDDTRMTLAEARGIIAAAKNDPELYLAAYNINSKPNLPEAVAREHLADWLAYPDHKFYGRTTRKALDALALGAPWRESGNSLGQGNGVAMRIAPLALWFAENYPDDLWPFYNRRMTRRLAKLIGTIGGITHKAPHSLVAGTLQAIMITKAYRFTGGSDEEWAETTYAELCSAAETAEGVFDSDEIISTIVKINTDGNNFLRGEKLRRCVSPGFSSTESCPFSWFTALAHAGSFEDGIIAAVNAGGDADTNGSMVGAILGAKFGLSGIKKESWISGLQKREEVLALADELYRVSVRK
ncbi:MAG: ADP-ribosylglycohydrolase family protein [Patescibacteria group bacterium]